MPQQLEPNWLRIMMAMVMMMVMVMVVVMMVMTMGACTGCLWVSYLH